jgi:hypothetical protein
MQDHNTGHRLAPRLAATLLALGSLCATPAFAGPDVGVSVQISQPGVYGRVDIGRFPQPEVIVTQPVIVRRAPVRPEPVYMWVPPGHQRHWSRHCREYNACGVPVYFVRDRWYQQHVRQERHEDRGPGTERYEGRREEHREERHEDRGGDHREGGHGDRRGHGRGH